MSQLCDCLTTVRRRTAHSRKSPRLSAARSLGKRRDAGRLPVAARDGVNQVYTWLDVEGITDMFVGWSEGLAEAAATTRVSTRATCSCAAIIYDPGLTRVR